MHLTLMTLRYIHVCIIWKHVLCIFCCVRMCVCERKTKFCVMHCVLFYIHVHAVQIANYLSCRLEIWKKTPLFQTAQLTHDTVTIVTADKLWPELRKSNIWLLRVAICTGAIFTHTQHSTHLHTVISQYWQY